MLRFARNDGARLAVIAFALFFVGAALADETPSPPPVNPEEAANLQSFATSHPQCNEWSDGCAVCLRENGVKCSLPGIACQAQDIVCKAP